MSERLVPERAATISILYRSIYLLFKYEIVLSVCALMDVSFHRVPLIIVLNQLSVGTDPTHAEEHVNVSVFRLYVAALNWRTGRGCKASDPEQLLQFDGVGPDNLLVLFAFLIDMISQ